MIRFFSDIFVLLTNKAKTIYELVLRDLLLLLVERHYLRFYWLPIKSQQCGEEFFCVLLLLLCVLCFCYCKRSIYLEQFYNLFSFFVLLLCFSFSLAVCSKSLVFFIQTVLLLQRFLFTQQCRGNSRNLARVPTIQIICTYLRQTQTANMQCSWDNYALSMVFITFTWRMEKKRKSVVITFSLPVFTFFAFMLGY